jgi:RimJ/RimL family protein N-acetyltransferase
MADDTAGGAALARDGELTIRPMRDEVADHQRIVTWRNRPHVREWWDPDDAPLTLEGAIDEYRQSSAESAAARSCIIELAGAPIGFVQFYPWSAYQWEIDHLGISVPDGAWSLDIFIGEESRLGSGLGSRTVALVCAHLFAESDATAVALGVEVTNERAQRAYEKAGLRRVREFLDSDTRNGERVRSFLMIRDRDTS